MDLGSILGFLQSAASLPYIGKPIVAIIAAYAAIVGSAAAAGTVATSIVAVWHGLQKFVAGFSFVPGLGFLSKASDWMKVEGDSLDSLNGGKVIPFLNRLSALPLPKKAGS